MVVYNTYLDKVNRPCKILCVDMTNENGMITVTLIVPAHFIERDEQKKFLELEYLLKISKFYQKVDMNVVIVTVLYRYLNQVLWRQCLLLEIFLSLMSKTRGDYICPR
jgi:hypothetical protein